MTQFAELPGVAVDWIATAEPLSSWLRYSVYRRLNGETGSGTRIAVINDPSLATYTDYTVKSAVAYDYNVTQTVQIGADEIESDFAAWATTELQIHSAFLHDVREPAYYVELQLNSQSHAIEQDAAYAQVWGRRTPTAHFGPGQRDTVELSLTDAWLRNPEAWTALRTLIDRQREQGSILMLRQHRDVRMFCQLEGPSRQDATVLYQLGLRAHEVFYEESV